MKNYLLIILVFVLFSSIAKGQFTVWGKQIGPDYRGIEPRAIATDTAGNVIYVGNDRTGMTDVDVFVRKLNPLGNTVWESRFNGNNNCHSLLDFTNVTTDLSGNIYVLGNANCNDLYISGFHLNDSINEYIKYFIIKLNVNGQLVYVKDVADDATAIKADLNGNCYVTGNAGTQKYDVNGNLMWINTNCVGVALDVSLFGNIFVTDGNSTFRLNSNSGNVNWQNSTLGGLSISCNDLFNRVYLVNTSGLKKIQFIGKKSKITTYNNLSGTKVSCDLIGNIYVNGNSQISKKSIWNGKITSLNTPFENDFSVNYRGQLYVLGAFNNIQNQITYCNFTIVKQSSNMTCLNYCEEDGYIIKVSFDAAPLYTEYSYSNVCINQNNPVSHCCDMNFNYGNIFKIQLSDANGSFSNPINVGTEPNAIIPAGLPAGNNYRLRIVSTSPVVIGTPTSPFNILPSSGAIAIAPVGSANLCDSNYVHLRATDSTGIAVNCNWYGNEYWMSNQWSYKTTGTDYIITTDGNYYAISTSCYNMSNSLDLSHDCKVAPSSINSSLHLTAYPNPSSDNFILKAEGVKSEGLLSVYDLSGSLIEKRIINSEQLTVFGGDWAFGIYICKVDFSGETNYLRLIKIK